MTALATPPAARAAGRAPIKVAVIDLEAVPAVVRAERADGREFVALWALLRRGGRPVGMVKLPFVGGQVCGAAIAAAAEAEPAADGAEAAAAALPLLPATDAVARPFASVIIPSLLERQDLLRRTLDSLFAMTGVDFEVVLVDNRRAETVPTHPAPAWLADYPVRLVAARTPGISAARNAGLAAARGEIVAFTDDDVSVDPGWLAAILDRFAAHPEETCVTGLVLPAELETEAQVTLEEYYGGFGPRIFAPVSHRMLPRRRFALKPAMVEELDEAGRTLRTFTLYAAGTFGPGANMAFRAGALRAMGGFDLALGAGTPTHGGEDLVMFARMAWRGQAIGFEPASLVHHVHRSDDASLRKQLEGYGVGFPSMLLALIGEDLGHAAAIAGTLPRGIASMAGTFLAKLRTADAPDPDAVAVAATGTPLPGGGGGTVAELARLELRGMLRGPAAYFRSLRIARRAQGARA